MNFTDTLLTLTPYLMRTEPASKRLNWFVPIETSRPKESFGVSIIGILHLIVVSEVTWAFES